MRVITVSILCIFLSASCYAQDNLRNYLSTHFHAAIQGHHLPTGDVTQYLRKPDGSPTSLTQKLQHKGKLMYGLSVQIHWNQRKFGKKTLKSWELSTALHMGYLRAPGSTLRSGRMDQIEVGLKESARYYVYPKVYLSLGLLVPIGMNSLFIGDMTIEPISFGGEVVSGSVNTRLNTTFIGTHPQLQIGYTVLHKKRNWLSLELGGSYHFWHNLRNRMLMVRGIGNVVIEDAQFWIKDSRFNGEKIGRHDFSRSGFQTHIGLRIFYL